MDNKLNLDPNLIMREICLDLGISINEDPNAVATVGGIPLTPQLLHDILWEDHISG